MAVERWDPFRDMVSLSDAFGSLLRDSYVRPGANPGGPALALPLDVVETDDEFRVQAALPGLKPEDVQITLHGDTLTIRGETSTTEAKSGETWHLRERRHGTFARTLTLATPIDPDRADARFEHGVLTLTLPKSERAKPRQIKIGAGANGSESAPVEAK